MGKVILEAENITKVYSNRRGENVVLENLSLQIEEGRLYSIEGESGSGKTTLLSIISGLQKPDEGRVIYRTEDKKLILNELKDDELTELRRHDIVYIPQLQEVLPTLSLIDNIRLVDCFDTKADTKNRVDSNDSRLSLILEELGLEKLQNDLPSELSGGELRRLIVARALYSDPKIILADEPTNDLDKDNRDKIRSIFRKAADRGVSVVVVTHDNEMAESADYRVRL